MICNEIIPRITKYFTFFALIVFHLCFAQDDAELISENEEGISWKPPRRHLLYSHSSGMDGTTKLIIYIVAVVVITLISACCKYCLKEGCEPLEDYSDTVVHPPPRRNNPTVPVAPSSGRRGLNPPRSSNSIILPPEPGIFTVDLIGIENPNYDPSIHASAPAYHAHAVIRIPSYEPRNVIPIDESSNENPTALFDLPPSYDSVIRGQNSNSAFSKVFDTPSK